MNTMHVMDFDLNLLKALDAVLETRSVTRAAQRLGLSQPATSHALGRLREALGDPLLVRVGSAQELTDHALRLKDAVKEALLRAEVVLAGPEVVTPARIKRTFVLNLADYTELTLLPRLVERLAREAPGISLTCRAHTWNAVEALNAGSDLWIGVNPPAVPGLMAQKLFSDGYRCAVRRAHPLATKRKISLDDFVKYKHVQIAPGSQPGGPLDDALAARGKAREVALRVPNFLVAPLLVTRTDLVLTAPRRMLDTFAPMVDLKVFEPPLPITGFTLQQAWLVRAHTDPVHRWFRNMVREISVAN
jgi:DNA-binding transcriptional LysR family regulator